MDAEKILIEETQRRYGHLDLAAADLLALYRAGGNKLPDSLRGAYDLIALAQSLDPSHPLYAGPVAELSAAESAWDAYMRSRPGPLTWPDDARREAFMAGRASVSAERAGGE